MKSNTTVLMLSLLIPVTSDTSAEQVINVIGQQVVEALELIHAQQDASREPTDEELAALEAADTESIAQAEFNASLLTETLEPYTTETHDDLLGKLGYSAPE